MICKNCGAKISQDILLCPYCGTENSDVAKKEQQDYINDYEKKKQELKNVPQKVLKKTTKWLWYCGCGIIGIVILAIIVVMGFSKLTEGDMLAKQEKELAKLESYYVAGDYEAMCKYLDKVVRYGGSYEKYRRVDEIYGSMDWHIESLESNVNYVKTIDLDAVSVEDDIERCIRVLAKIQEFEELGFLYGEDAGALYVKEQYYNALKEYALLTEDEIDSAVLNYQMGTNENDYLSLAEISIQRMEEKYR